LKTKLFPIILSVIILLIVSQACATSGAPTPISDSAVGTIAAATIFAGLSQTPQTAVPIASLESATPTLTFTPTSTPTQTLTQTPIFTLTPLIPQISVSVATNCRVGPGKVYDRVGALLVGEVAEVVGHDLAGNYWYIRNPDSSAGFCWVWGEYATLSGNTSTLPIFTPPPSPTPTPNFKVSYVGMDSCVGWWVEFKLENTGDTIFKSVSISVKDTNTNTTLSIDANGFTNVDGCLTSDTKDTLPVGQARRVSSAAFAYDPSGHKLRAMVTLCTGTKQTGTCTSDEIEFKP